MILSGVFFCPISGLNFWRFFVCWFIPLIALIAENLNAAKLLLENEIFNASASRACYAAFLAGVWALEHAGVSAEEISHKRLQAMFNLERIHRRKIYPRRFRSNLVDMLDLRIEADYKRVSISHKKGYYPTEKGP